MDVDALVQKLKRAADAYYNTDTPLMSDAEYDALLETLPANHPYRKEVRAPASSGSTFPLPYPLPSLDKIKPGMPALTRFLGAPQPIIISNKLDGISALWNSKTGQLALGGDGLNGVDVSHTSQHIQGLVKTGQDEYIVRGELIIRKTDAPEDTISRSWVNGLFHQKTPSASDLAKVHFIAYEIMNLVETARPSQQLTLLANAGFEVPFYTRTSTASEESLKTIFQERRAASTYEIDGIVLTRDILYTQPRELKNPKHAVAFKMPLADQCATTTVREIVWQASRQGFLIPRIRCDPVKISGSTIEFITGHNAAYIKENSLGPGAKIRIRKSGDIIPIVDEVLEAAAQPAFPVAGTWRWNETEIHILATDATQDQVQQQLLHFFKTLDVPGVGPGTIRSLMDAGFNTPGEILKASVAQLKEILGPTLGQRLHDSYREKLAAASDKTLMLASSLLPRGFGAKKLDATEPSSWPNLPAFERWKLENFAGLAAPSKPSAAAAPQPTGWVLCFSGFRDKDLKTVLEAQGHTVSDSLTKKTTHLIIPDKSYSSSKTAKCSPLTKILTKEEFLALL